MERGKDKTAGKASGDGALQAQEIVSELRRALGDRAIDVIYRERIIPQRTRRYEWQLPRSGGQVEILHTLLGIELKIGTRRLACPDLATARYISVFAKLGCNAVAIPYDITRLSTLADELESSWHRTNVLIDHLTAGRTGRLRNLVRRRVIERLREGVEGEGAGAQYPKFNQSTRERSVDRRPSDSADKRR